mgnify:CR=1 FL=1
MGVYFQNALTGAGMTGNPRKCQLSKPLSGEESPQSRIRKGRLVKSTSSGGACFSVSAPGPWISAVAVVQANLRQKFPGLFFLHIANQPFPDLASQIPEFG